MKTVRKYVLVSNHSVRRHLRKVHILYPVRLIFCETSYKFPTLKEVTVIGKKNNCLVIELQLPIDKNEYSLDEISIAVDSDGKCYLNVDDVKPFKTWKCDLTCRTFGSEDRQIIIDLKNEFCKNVRCFTSLG